MLWLIYTNKKVEKKILISIWLMTGYYLTVLVSTVFSRTSLDFYNYDINIFNFVNKLIYGNIDNRYEVYLNILLLLPVGFLLAVIFNKKIDRIIVTGFSMSLIIELLQLILKKGTFEISDLLMNTFGVILGVGIYQFFFFIFKRLLCKQIKKIK
jgi:glycopeptide antibiotics resistance protein